MTLDLVSAILTCKVELDDRYACKYSALHFPFIKIKMDNFLKFIRFTFDKELCSKLYSIHFFHFIFLILGMFGTKHFGDTSQFVVKDTRKTWSVFIQAITRSIFEHWLEKKCVGIFWIKKLERSRHPHSTSPQLWKTVTM